MSNLPTTESSSFIQVLHLFQLFNVTVVFHEFAKFPGADPYETLLAYS